MLESEDYDFQKFYRIINKPLPMWFNKKRDIDNKINAIIAIGKKESVQVIPHLFDVLNVKNLPVSVAACDVIIKLSKNIKDKNGYYGVIKYCRCSIDQIENYQKKFDNSRFMQLMGICSFNRNGYIREKAIDMMSECRDGEVIEYLIYRVADWVPQVRAKAIKGLQNFLKPEYLDDLIRNIDLIKDLRKVERVDLSALYYELMEFIIDKNRQYLLSIFRKLPDKTRYIIASYITETQHLTDCEIKLFAKDCFFMVRNILSKHLDSLDKEQVDMLLHDKSSRVRIQTLYSLKKSGIHDEILLKFVADESAVIRNFARFYIADNNYDYSKLYHNNLKEDKNIIGSLAGLAELDARQHSELIKGYLLHKKLAVRKVAFRALVKLDKEFVIKYCKENMDKDIEGLNKLISGYLSINADREVITKARDISRNSDIKQKKYMLKIMGYLCSWAALPDIMLATIDDNAEIRAQALVYLSIWRCRAAHVYIMPDKDEKERLSEVFGYVYDKHTRMKYFKENPLEGLEFHIRR